MSTSRSTRPTAGREGMGAARMAQGSSGTRPDPTPNNAVIRGLAPPVDQRPPATSNTSITLASEDVLDDSYLMEQMEMDDDEDEALLIPCSLITPNQGTASQDPPSTEPDPNNTSTEPDSNNTSDKLLALRKNYKKTSVALAKARAHSDFLSSCRNKGQTPKGLKVNVHCSPFLVNLTNIQDQFLQTSRQAEQHYVSHLNDHYDKVVNELSQKQTLLQNTMTTVLTRATRVEKETHLSMLEKTDNNTSKLLTELQKGKKRKLNNITQPSNPKRKPKNDGAKSTYPSTENTYPIVSTPHRPPQQTQLAPTAQFQAPVAQSLLNLTIADLFAGLQRQATSPPTLQLQPQPQVTTPLQLQPQMGTTHYRVGQPPHVMQSPQLPQAYCMPGVGQSLQLTHSEGRVGPGQLPQLPQTQTTRQHFGQPGRLSLQQPNQN